MTWTALLARFPRGVHPLTLVSDPDGVLADVELRAAIGERGFTVIAEDDPVELRYAVQQHGQASTDRQLIVVTAGALNALPYDLWQQGDHVTLDLAELFPHLALSAVRALTPAQRRLLAEGLASEAPIDRDLTQPETAALALRLVFGIAPDRWLTPAALLLWLEGYHARGEAMPAGLRRQLIDRLRQLPAFAGWPLDDILGDITVLQSFLEGEWRAYVRTRTGDARDVTYDPSGVLPIASDQELERALRDRFEAPPAAPAVIATSDAATATDPERAAHLLAAVEEQLGHAEIGWAQWQRLARDWADLTLLRYGPAGGSLPDVHERYGQLCAGLDDRFQSWLAAYYAPLSGRVLPAPHHLHHIPTWLAHRAEAQLGQRQALIILDGMSLADWHQIRSVWQARRPGWAYDERLVLAQIPSVTAVSRQALVGGLPPARFRDSLRDNRQDAQRWATFWGERGVPAGAAAYVSLTPALGGEYPAEISSRRTQALCLVSTVIDEMVHGASQGAADQQAALGVWLRSAEDRQHRSQWLEGLIQHLFDFGYTVTVTSDHGHVEATGIGQPREGVLVISRSKRARLYENLDVAREVHAAFPETILWHGDGLLPPDVYVLMPRGRRAFVAEHALVVSHGGLTIDEMLVPVISIARS